MTTDQEKSATPLTGAQIKIIVGTMKIHHPVAAEAIEQLERANIQLREELEFQRIGHQSAQDKLLLQGKELSVATEQLAIAQASNLQTCGYKNSHIDKVCSRNISGCHLDHGSRVALDEEIRKAMLKCADVMDEREDIARVVGICIRQYANSLTPTSQQSTEPSE